MKKKKVILSFDYELFFGDKSGTVLKTLIEPTNKILDAMDSVGFKGNFFIDWQMLKYLKEENTERTLSDYNLIKNQLKDMVRRGHRIELHIHPHWVDAKYNGDGTWNFDDFSHYSLQSFTQSEITKLFEEGVGLLTAIAQDVDPSYKIVAFRAGGWAIQPFDKIKEGFIKTGIMIDSSASFGQAAVHKDSFYDFRNMPKKGLYRFNNDVCEEDEKGCFIEVPISSQKRIFINKVLTFLIRKTTNRFAFLTDGTHYRAKDVEFEEKNQPPVSRKDKIGMMGLRENPLNMPINIYRHPNNLICFIDHPKDFNGLTCGSLKWIGRTSRTITYFDLYKEYCNNE